MYVSLPAQAIVIRDDVDDGEYLAAAGSYEAVFDVFEKRGGVGTLISSELAITAGHVGQDIPVGHKVEIAGAQYEVERVILHPEWESNNREMALFKLDRPVVGIDPILPYDGSGELNQIVTFVGRGDTGTGLTGPVTADHELRAATNRFERVEGGTLVFRFDSPDDENVTPLEGVSGPGDSGGPALMESGDGLRLVGLSVASSGRPPGTYGNWEFYSRVSPDVDWINEVLASEIGSVPGESNKITPITGVAGDDDDRTRFMTYISLAAVITVLILSTALWRRRRSNS